ncbi:hypothetical protein PIB30_042450 [Stylosanthes scabra]|uniref:MD-2-related lipid-recognition domain-containing protein n=1 Tax=Stylosanthes scabra TaxID=79078 RepID=A0ABU6UDV4_9FABA|nr:hypothetical protein [Stylosanthes scabra]
MEFQFPPIPKLYLLLCLSSILLLSSFHAHASGYHFRYCAEYANYPVKISRLEVTPHPIVRARRANFKIFASSAHVICGGKWVIKVSYMGLVVHKKMYNLCEAMSCPVHATKFTVTRTQRMPLFAPQGIYTVEISLRNRINEPFTCIIFNLRFVSRFFGV